MTKITSLWYGLSIQRKIVTLFSSLLLMVGILYTFTLTTAFKYLDAYEQDLSKTSGVHSLQIDIDQLHANFEGYLVSPGEQQFLAFSRASNLVWGSWGEVQRVANTSLQAMFQINAFQFGLSAYLDTAHSSFQLRIEQDENYIQSILKTRRIYGYLRNYSQELLRIRLQEGSDLLIQQARQVKQTQYISYGFLGFFGLFLSFIGSRFSSSLSRPIKLLAERSTKIAEGDLTTTDISLPNTDELGVLSRAFNTMNGNIHAMVESLKEKVEIEKRLFDDERKIIEMNRSLREAQFLNLQAQVSPHFFFNTLNTISRMSLFEKAPETLKLIQSLSAIFRYTLNDRSKMMRLKDELEILTEYLHIQKIRYGERLRTTIKIDPHIKPDTLMLPVFTLQPLVENAIKYAVEPREDGGCICVTILDNESNVSISISDDGPGIEKSRLHQVLHNPKSEGTSEIGLLNVSRRLEITFGKPDLFSVFCPETGGTIVTLEIPKETDDKNSYCR